MNKNDFLKLILNTTKKNNNIKDPIFSKLAINSEVGKFASSNLLTLASETNDEEKTLLSFKNIDGNYFAEVEYDTFTIIAKATVENGAISFSGSKVSKVNGSQSAVALTNRFNGNSITPILLLLVTMAYEKELDDIGVHSEGNFEHFDLLFLLGSKTIKECLSSLTDELSYERLQEAAEVVTDKVKEFIRDNDIDMTCISDGTKEFQQLDVSSLIDENFDMTDIYGKVNNSFPFIIRNEESSILMKESGEKETEEDSKQTLIDLKALAINKNPLSDEQLIAYKAIEMQMEQISIPESLERTMRSISKEIPGRKNVRNLILQGLPGAGKSFMTKILAYCNNMLHTQELGSGEKIYPTDFFATLIPNTEKYEGTIDENGAINVDKLIDKNNRIPSLTDAMFMPEMTYKVLTGNEWKESTPPSIDELSSLIDERRKQVYEETIKTLLDTKVSRSQVNEDAEFVMVYTELGKALIEGNYVVDVQEIDTIKNPDSLSFLYEVLEEGWVSLPNGKRVQRHPNTIVCFTVNGSTGGDITKPLPPAFRDRCQIELKFGEMTVEEMADRIYASYKGSIKKSVLIDMAELVKIVEETIQDENLEGFVGFRSLSNWVDATYRTGDAYQACIDTVINKTTDDAEEIQNLITNILDNSKFKEEQSKKIIRELFN